MRDIVIFCIGVIVGIGSTALFIFANNLLNRIVFRDDENEVHP